MSYAPLSFSDYSLCTSVNYHNHFHDIALNLIQSDNHCNFLKFLVNGETGKSGPYVVQLVELEIKLGQENATTPPHSMEESVLGTARKRKHAR